MINLTYKMLLSLKASIEIKKLPKELLEFTKDNFDKLFYYHPENRCKICINENEVYVNRWQKSYGNVPKNKKKKGFYMFHGQDEAPFNDLEPEFQKILEWANKDGAGYNQVTVCWYESPKDYIALHSDYCEKMDHTVGVTVINLCKSDEFPRFFQVSAKGTGDNCVVSNLEIPLYHGTVITMKGEEAQNKFLHGVAPVNGFYPGPRIGISLRKYKIKT